MPSDQNIRILFLARRYPPSTGGVQTHCFQLFTHLSALQEVRLVALRRNHLAHLIWFIPYAFVIALSELFFHRVDAIYFGDGVTCCLATFLRPFSKARFVVTVYGLEMTYSHQVFSRLMKWGINHCQQVVVISEITRRITVHAEIPAERLSVVYLGIEPSILTEERHQILRAGFEKEHGIRFGHDKVLLNYCRQVPRKGLAAFLRNGVPLLEKDIRFFIGGSGPECEHLHQLREELGLHDQIVLLGWLDDEITAMLRREADLFLMPNVQIPYDVEGFGISQLECMYVGLPVVAFAVDALVESVREGGYLIPEGDYQAFADAIHSYLSLPPAQKENLRQEAASYVRREFSWDKTTDQYLQIFEGTVDSSK